MQEKFSYLPVKFWVGKAYTTLVNVIVIHNIIAFLEMDLIRNIKTDVYFFEMQIIELNIFCITFSSYNSNPNQNQMNTFNRW